MIRTDDRPRLAVAFALLSGMVLTVAAVLGFALTGWQDLTTVPDQQLLGMSVTPLLNLAHLVAGATLITGARSGTTAAWVVTLLAAAGFGVLGLLGLLMVGDPADPLGLDGASTGLHLVVSAAATAIATFDARDDTGSGRSAARAPKQSSNRGSLRHGVVS